MGWLEEQQAGVNSLCTAAAASTEMPASAEWPLQGCTISSCSEPPFWQGTLAVARPQTPAQVHELRHQQQQQQQQQQQRHIAGAATAAAVPAPASLLSLPAELLATIVRRALAVDAEEGRQPVIQFTSRAVLAAYRSAAYASFSLDVPAAYYHLLGMQQARAAPAVAPPDAHVAARAGALATPAFQVAVDVATAAAAAERELLRWLAARLPHARVLQLRDLEGAPTRLQARLAALLLSAAQAGCLRGLRSLSCAWLPCLPLLLPQLRLSCLSLSLPAAELVARLPLLLGQPLRSLAIQDAADACPDGLIVCLSMLTGLHTLSLLGGGGGDAYDAEFVPGGAGDANADPTAASCLPSLELVAAAAALPGLRHLELSLTFSSIPAAAAEQKQVQRGLGLGARCCPGPVRFAVLCLLSQKSGLAGSPPLLSPSILTLCSISCTSEWYCVASGGSSRQPLRG